MFEVEQAKTAAAVDFKTESNPWAKRSPSQGHFDCSAHSVVLYHSARDRAQQCPCPCLMPRVLGNMSPGNLDSSGTARGRPLGLERSLTAPPLPPPSLLTMPFGPRPVLGAASACCVVAPAVPGLRVSKAASDSEKKALSESEAEYVEDGGPEDAVDSTNTDSTGPAVGAKRARQVEQKVMCWAAS